ncbi:PREDICTED: ATP-dependent RNA helicase DDX24 [Nicrophorus vespilloides]|uniref:ATP-dependent RNA helicase n=1 Tax=Nicrophorus vespilloides TaxID=110193 RepID=A0ABM1MUC7_NICVS|nr:PREDICTED: ATP-dependent RNA helicase DDX24 [Nicrophorus vespilloides]
MVKKSNWKSVTIDATGNFEGLLGIEECTDYNISSFSKKKYKKRTREEDSDGVPKKKIKNNNAENSNDENNKIEEEAEKEIMKGKKTMQQNLKKDKKKNNKKVIEPLDSKNLEESKGENSENESEKEISNSKKNAKKGNKKKKKKRGKKGKKPVKVDNKEDDDQETLEKEDIVKEEVNMDLWNIVPLPQPVLDVLASKKFTQPTEIQTLTLPAAILGYRDILGAAETGSGKTLAFGLPIISGILRMKKKLAEEESESDNGMEEDENEIELEENDDSEAESDENEAESEIEDSERESENEECEVESANEECEAESEDNEDYEAESDDNEESEADENESEEEEVENEDSEETTNGIGCVKVIDDIDIPGIQLPKKKRKNPLYALILTPTRELAVQIKNHLLPIAKSVGIQLGVVIGGMAAVKQERVLSKGPEIVIATPGRLWETIQQNNEHLMNLDEIKFLAIDETDRMLEKGHFQELHDILLKINGDGSNKQTRQNFVFSATLTLIHELPSHIKKKNKWSAKKTVEMTPAQKLKKVVDQLGITNPKIVDITKGTGTSSTLTECKISCTIDEKDYYMYYFLKRHPGRTLVFCNSIGCVKRLHTLFEMLGCKPLSLHASMQQTQRLKNLDRFRDTENSVLIATDVAARGLDIPSVQHVIHYQTPRTSESYVHRSGRTARASKEGITILLVEITEVHHYINLCKTLGKTEDIPIFPVERKYFEAVKERVNLARNLDKLDLKVRKSTAEVGWFEKAAKEMDMIIDDKAMKYDLMDSNKLKKECNGMRKNLSSLLNRPLFPDEYRLSEVQQGLQIKAVLQNQMYTRSAIDVMKDAIVNKKLKDQRKIPKSMFKKAKKEHEVILPKQLLKKTEDKGSKKGKNNRNRKKNKN